MEITVAKVVNCLNSTILSIWVEIFLSQEKIVPLMESLVEDLMHTNIAVRS